MPIDNETLGAAVAIAKANPASEQAITNAVNDWLDDHPEATTTVQDGSITKAKLDNNLQVKVDELDSVKNAIEDLEAGSLSAVGATNGQLPTADGEGSWDWQTPNFIRATDDQGQPIVIPEIDDSTTSADDVWSSQKTNTEISGKYTKPVSGIPASDLADGIATVIETVSGTTPTITGAANHRYICGEVSTISIMPPASGIIDVVFESGSTAAVLTATGVQWPAWFDPAALEANATYELNIMDGTLGAVGVWM